MKTILSKIGLLLIAVIPLITSCSDDRDSNPTLSKEIPEFVLNTPAYSLQSTDLSKGGNLHFTWKQPAYGFKAVASYSLQLSINNKWTDAVKDAQGNELSAATYYNLPGTFTADSGDVASSNLNFAIAKLSDWTNETSVSSQPIVVYIRCISQLDANGTGKVYSNSVPITVLPFYVSVISYPAPWYLTGEGINGWMGGDQSAANEKTIPLDEIQNATYDSKWAGAYAKTLYIESGKGFKIVAKPNDWNIQIGSSDGSLGGIVWNDGGSKDIKVTESGYYKFDLNSQTNSLTIVKTVIDEKTHPIHSSMTISGSALAAPIMMTACSSNGHNHIWFTTVHSTKGNLNFTDETGAKYGNNTFPYGFASKGLSEIATPKGTFSVFYDDLSGCYQFLQVK
jgi:starch-binding outer membrane protein SusE/F